MRSVHAVLLSTLVGSGCGTPRPPEASAWAPWALAALASHEDRPAEPPTGYAVVARGTPLRTRPDAQAPSIPMPGLTPYYGTSEHDGPPRGTVVMVAGVDGDFLEIETAAMPAGVPHCEDAQLGLEPLRLRLYVRREGVLPVTVRPVEQRLDDGRRVRLSAGVPLRPASPDSDRWIASALGVRLELPLPEDAVGRFYVPEPRRGDVVATDCIDLETQREEAPPLRPGTVASTSWPRSPPSPPVYPTGVLAYHRGWGEPKAAVYPGTVVRWPDGRIAGQVTEPLQWEPGGDEIDRLHCTRTPVILPQALPLRVCFDPADVHDPVTAALAAAVGHPTITEPTRHGSVYTQPPRMTGALAPSAVSRIARSRSPELHYCYALALSADPGIDGELSLRLEIASDGTLAAASVETSTLHDPDLEACILRASRGWSFPAHPGTDPAIATLPLVFSRR